MKINKESLERFRNDFKKAMAPLEEDFGLNIRLGSMSYDDLHFTGKITCKSTEKIDGKTVEQIEFEKLCKLYGFEPKDYKQQYKDLSNGDVFELSGFNTRASKNPIKIRRVKDKIIYTCSPLYLQRALSKIS